MQYRGQAKGGGTRIEPFPLGFAMRLHQRVPVCTDRVMIAVGGGGATAGELQLQGPEIQDGALRHVEGYCVVGGHRFISKRDQRAGVAGDV